MSESLLAITGLHAGYGANRVLGGVDMSIERGEWLSLLGPNASGKSTLVRCVSGQMQPRAGEIRIAGKSVVREPRAAKRLLGFAHPPERLPGLLTGWQCLEVYAAAHELPALDPTVVELADRFRLTPLLGQFVESYSLGSRQKLSILLAFSANPALILLDEAFNGLDPASSLVLKKHLHERVNSGQCGVLLATHSLDVVLSYSTRVALLLDGRLRRAWSQQELATIRASDPDALEVALAEAAATA